MKKLNKLLVIVLCTVVGGTLLGIEVNKYWDSNKLEDISVRDVYVPINISKDIPPLDVITVKYNLSLNTLRALIGIILGGLFGVYVTPLISRNINVKWLRRRIEGLKSNFIFTICFIILTVVIWLAFVIIGINIKGDFTRLEFGAMKTYLGIFSVVCAWGIVGRKIRFGHTTSQILNWVLLGPFNCVKIEFFNTKQKKLIWVGILMVVFVLLFPPWIGFGWESNNKGIGDVDFIGFHFFRSSQYEVLYDAPYAIAQIWSSMEKMIIVGVISGVLLGILCFRNRPANV